jgi:hypothetical protein
MGRKEPWGSYMEVLVTLALSKPEDAERAVDVFEFLMEGDD